MGAEYEQGFAFVLFFSVKTVLNMSQSLLITFILTLECVIGLMT